ncbi:hypothetical protein MCESTEH50_00155 [Candidatus Methylopumilus universalis]|uniref:hypothetical protein n=1 Tax=Candidatus Methylopumilus universalis TaxID=2588536 RepID=UPI003BEF39A2
MLPGNTYVRECPHCSGKFTQPTMASGNTFGAKFWPDGKIDAPMMPDYPAYVSCPYCKGTFWVEDTKVVKSIGYDEEREIPDLTLDSNQNPIPYKNPTRKIYLQGLDDLNISKENEVYLRSKLMQLFNDVNRDQKEQRPAIAAQIENWNRLLKILDPKDTQEKLLRVEIYREMGNFEEAKKVLAGELDEEYMDTMDILDKLIEARDSRVMCINPHDD